LLNDKTAIVKKHYDMLIWLSRD